MWETDRDTDTVNRLLTMGVVAAVVLGFVGAGVGAVAASGQGDGEAQVRVAHLSPDAPPVDVLVDGQEVLTAVEFGTVSDYLAVSAGEHRITIQTAENDTVVFEGNVTVEAGTKYTVAATGEVSEETFRPRVFVDDFETPSDGNASVRLVHASPDAPAVDVTVAGSGAVLYDNVSFGNASDYVTVPAGNYTLEVRPATANNSGDVVATFDVSLEGATAYTAFAAGYLTTDDEPTNESFGLVVARDSAGTTMNMTAE